MRTRLRLALLGHQLFLLALEVHVLMVDAVYIPTSASLCLLFIVSTSGSSLWADERHSGRCRKPLTEARADGANFMTEITPLNKTTEHQRVMTYSVFNSSRWRICSLYAASKWKHYI